MPSGDWWARNSTTRRAACAASPNSCARQLLRLKNSGYEFELDMLVHCRRAGVPIVACPIATVYLDDNRSSHFHPLLDSLRIYAVFLRFIAASLVTAAVDYCVFLLVFPGLASLLTAQAVARLVAVGVNFVLARQAVFRSRSRLGWSLAKFILLVVVMGATSYCLIRAAMYAFGWPVIAAKMASELMLYLANFVIQRDFIFRDAAERQPPAARKARAAGRRRSFHTEPHDVRDRFDRYYRRPGAYSAITRRMTVAAILAPMRRWARPQAAIAELGGGNSCLFDLYPSGIAAATIPRC